MSTPTPDPAPSRELAAQLVRYVAARAVEPTIVTIGESADGIPVVTEEGFPDRRVGGSFEGILTDTADFVRRRPRGIPTSACALVLPARDLAYLYHDDSGDSLADVVATGPDPIDLPITRAEVSRGLATLMRALTDTQQRPMVAGAFLADPTARIGLIPNQPAPPPPAPPSSAAPAANPQRFLEPAMSQPTPATPAEPAAPRPPSMRDRWAELITGRHSPRRWAVIAAAIATADATPVDRFRQPVQRGDESWCQVAITALERPTRTAAHGLPDALSARCFANPGLLRAWLNAPAPYADHGRTIADSIGRIDWHTASHEAIHMAVVDLFGHAQDGGLFGVDGYRLQAHRLVDTDDAHAGYLLVARPPLGPGLAADEPVDDALIPTRERSFVDGAVRLLTNAAAMLDAALDSRDAAQTATLPTPSPNRGQPFRSRDRSTGTEPPPARDAGAPAGPRHPRTR